MCGFAQMASTKLFTIFLRLWRCIRSTADLSAQNPAFVGHTARPASLRARPAILVCASPTCLLRPAGWFKASAVAATSSCPVGATETTCNDHVRPALWRRVLGNSRHIQVAAIA